VGAIQKRKNIARLLDAFERVPSDWRLALAGSAGFGADEILGKIGNSRVSVLGYVSAAELDDWYARAMILAFPSLDEGLGIRVIEAMAAGVPVITSNRSALTEVAGDAALQVNPESVEELSAALCAVATDAELREGLRQKGLQRALAFSWPKAVENTWNVYRELL